MTINIGDKRHAFTVIEVGLRKPPSPSRARAGAKSEAAVRVVCECGESLLLQPTQFRDDVWKSCGCWSRRAASARATARNTTHGMTHHPLYQVWQAMRARCENRAHQDYPRYGGRGITVTPAWRDVQTFVAYIDTNLGPRPDDYSLDRIDNQRGYEPDNIRWASAIQQRRNQDRYTGAP